LGPATARPTAATTKKLLEYSGEIALAVQIKIFDADIRSRLPPSAARRLPRLLGAAERFKRIRPTAGPRIDAGMPELVVVLPFGFVGKNVVRFLHLFEFFFGLGIVFIYIRMKLPHEFAVRFADFICGSGTGDA
jgi:hypothetical protein